MNLKTFTSIIAGFLLSVSTIANAGLINDIATETVTYDISTGGFGWTASYDISFVQQDLLIDVDIFLTGDDPGAALRDIWEDGIESVWSTAFDIFDGLYYYDTIFNIDWLTSSVGADHTVDVHSGDGNVNLVDWYTGNPSGWGYGKQGTIAAHEFGHMIGLFDEYSGGALDPVTKLIRNNSIMGSNLAAPQVDHFDQFIDWASLNSGSQTLSLTANSGEHYYNVPEPSTFALLVLSIMGFASRKFKK